MEYPRGTERLRIGIPVTVEHGVGGSAVGGSNHGGGGGGGGGGGSATGTAISNTTESFITFLDALKIHMHAKDSLHPLLSDVITSANVVTNGQDFDGRAKIVHWLITLNQMKANDEINEAQARELSFDMEQAYYGFKSTLR